MKRRTSSMKRQIKNYFENISTSTSLQILNSFLGDGQRNSEYRKIARNCKQLVSDGFLLRTPYSAEGSTQVWYTLAEIPVSEPSGLDSYDPSGFWVFPNLFWDTSCGPDVGIWTDKTVERCLWNCVWYTSRSGPLESVYYPGKSSGRGTAVDVFRIDPVLSQLRCTRPGSDGLSDVQIYYELQDAITRNVEGASELFAASSEWVGDDVVISGWERIREFLRIERRSYNKYEFAAPWSPPPTGALYRNPERSCW